VFPSLAGDTMFKGHAYAKTFKQPATNYMGFLIYECMYACIDYISSNLSCQLVQLLGIY
jgi:hypothetical protein